MYHVLNSISAIGKSNVSCAKDSDCNSLNLTCIQGHCAKSLTRIHDAYGTGIEVDYNNRKFVVVNESWSTWTQSFSGTSEVRAFWRDPISVALGMLFAGLAMIIGSVFFSSKLLAYFKKKFKY